jgi:hypothetical protein
LASLSALSRLVIANMNCQSELAWIASLGALRDLSLHQCDLRNDDTAALSELKLISLSLVKNLELTWPLGLSRMPLERLNLAWTGIELPVVHICRMSLPSLKHLDLSYCSKLETLGPDDFMPVGTGPVRHRVSRVVSALKMFRPGIVRFQHGNSRLQREWDEWEMQCQGSPSPSAVPETSMSAPPEDRKGYLLVDQYVQEQGQSYTWMCSCGWRFGHPLAVKTCCSCGTLRCQASAEAEAKATDVAAEAEEAQLDRGFPRQFLWLRKGAKKTDEAHEPGANETMQYHY